jgi:thiol-disulfide isomerase/thioredoxin
MKTPVPIRLLLPLLAAPLLASAAEPKPMTDFELVKWETTEKVRLSDFAGKIVVLDFFAYWCQPCRRASVELETGVQKFYAAKSGNPQGVPVQVVAVNIERDHPELTAKYVLATGTELVLNDFDGMLLEKLGGAGTPFIVVIDGSHATKDKPDFRLLYTMAGFEGTKKLRQVIDGVKPPAPAAKTSAEHFKAVDQATGPPVIRQFEVSFEGMFATDIDITSSVLSYDQKQGGTEWKIGYTHNTIGEDYEPYSQFDFLGYAENIHSTYNSGTVSVRQAVTDKLTVLAGGGAYYGFTDFRSLWLANYYQQQFDFVPGYQTPYPKGFNFSSGLRWEYQPTTGFVEAGFLYAYDQIAPGYEFDPELNRAVHNDDVLRTYSPSLNFENVLTPWLRTLNEFRITFTTGRESRFAYRGSVNTALGENLVGRVSGGYTTENPTLRAWFAGGTLEYALTKNWLVNVSGLFYHDTGEIENSLFISTAAPGLTTWQGGPGLRYIGERMSFSLSAAALRSVYDPLTVGTRPFTNLYQNRTWLALQAAWSLTF